MNYNECDVFQEGSRKWMICRGEAGLSIEKTNAYRKQWGLAALDAGTPVAQNVTEDIIPEFIFHGKSVSNSEIIKNKLYGPGTELLRIYEAAGVPTCDACKELAQDMNNYGIAECRKRIEEFVADILPRAKAWLDAEHPWAMKLIPNAFGEYAISARIRSDITKAIDESEKVITERRIKNLDIFTGEKKKGGCSACGGGTIKNTVPKH